MKVQCELEMLVKESETVIRRTVFEGKVQRKGNFNWLASAIGEKWRRASRLPADTEEFRYSWRKNASVEEARVARASPPLRAPPR